jgi:NAD dependent epimerase/dehydratase family enzyme
VCIVAPYAVKQRKFAKILSGELHRPCFLSMPDWFVHLIFGQMGDELLARGQHVKPTRLLEMGFTYHCQTLKQALKKLL